MLWKQESFGVLRPLQIEFFRNLLDHNRDETHTIMLLSAPPRGLSLKDAKCARDSLVATTQVVNRLTFGN